MSSQRAHSIAVLPGDGIGPEVIRAAVEVVNAASRRFGFMVRYSEYPVGGAALDASGDPLPSETLEGCLSADAVLLGAVGGPRWNHVSADHRPEQGLLRLRSSLGVYANLRPVRTESIDVLIVRELTGGIYFGRPSDRRTIDGVETARDTMVYTRPEVERIARVAFDMARRRRGAVTSVDKANVLETSRLWREVVTELFETEYSDLKLNHEYVDIAAMKLVSAPEQFDVILTGNMFGDILSDLAAALPGSVGLLPSASIGVGPGVFEPVHGSAPDIVGLGIANPIGAIGSAAMMLDFLGESRAAVAISSAVDVALRDGVTTADLRTAGSNYSNTKELTEEILTRLVAPDQIEATP